MAYDNQPPKYSDRSGGDPSKSVAILLLVFIGILVSSIYVGYSILKKPTDESKINLSGNVIKKNETVVNLSAQILRKQIEKIFIIGEHYANRPEFIKLIQQEKWEEAGIISSGILNETAEKEIEMFFITDTEGTAHYSMPDSPVVGADLSFRDWYRGVSELWLPYLSEVYTRLTEPTYNIATFATPVKDPDGQPIGILGFQVRLDIFQDWISQVHLGSEGKTFIVDQNGIVVAHPDLFPQVQLIDYSKDRDVEQALLGKTGTEVLFNKIDFISSFTPINPYNWSVITRVPLKEVYGPGSESDAPLSRPNNILILIILVSNILIAIIFWNTIRSMLRKSN